MSIKRPRIKHEKTFQQRLADEAANSKRLPSKPLMVRSAIYI